MTTTTQDTASRVSAQAPPSPLEETLHVDYEKGLPSHNNSAPLSGNEGSTDKQTANASSEGLPDSQGVKPLRLTILASAVTLCVFLVALDLTIIGTAIPRITDRFHSLSQVGWYGSAFFLTVAAFQPTWGKAFKYFDLKLAYLASIFVFEVGSLICGVANSSTTLIVGRAVAGVGAAGLASGAYTIIAFIAPVRLRPLLIGVIGIAFCVSSVLGPLLGGVFTDNLSWRWCFYINLPIGGVAAACIVIFFSTPEAAKPKSATLIEKVRQLDLPGSFTIMAAVICYLLALQWGGVTKSWSDADVIGCLVGFGLLMCVLVAIEYISGERALIVPRLLKDRTTAALSTFIFFAAGVFFVLLYYLPIYFQTTRGISAQQSGIDNIPLVLAAGLSSLFAGGMITAKGHYVPILLVGSALAAVGAGLIYTLEIHSPSREWIGYQVLLGIGIGSVFQMPFTAAQALASPEDLSTVTAMILCFQTLGGALWLTAAQSGFANVLIHSLRTNAPGVNPALVVATGATELRNVFRPEQLPGILVSYLDGLKVPFAVSIACGCVITVVSVVPRWEKVNVKL